MTKIGDYLKVFGNVASAIQAENASTHVSAVNDSDVVLYEKGYTNYSEEYFNISLTDVLSGIQMLNVKSIDISFELADGVSGDLYYSIDLQTWNIMDKIDNSFSTPSYEYTILQDRKIYLKGNLSPSLTNQGIGKFTLIKCTVKNGIAVTSNINQTYNLSGNIMSLCWGDAFKAHHNCDVPYYFADLFSGCVGNKGLYLDNLVLPNSLSPYCFHKMFFNCTIYSYPKLPALNLEEGCYMGMFGSMRSTKNNSPLSITINLDLPAQYVPKKAYSGMLDSFNNKFSGTINMNYVSYENEDAVKLFMPDYSFATSIQQQFVPNALTINMPNCNVYNYNNNSSSAGICNYFSSFNATTTIGNNTQTTDYEIIKKYDNTNAISEDIKFNTLNTNCNGINIDNSNSVYTLTYKVNGAEDGIAIIQKSSINNYEFITECSGTLNLYEYDISDMGTTNQYTIINSQFIEIDNELPKPIITCEYNIDSEYPNILISFDSIKIRQKLNQSQSSVRLGYAYILYNISNYPFTLNEKFDNNTNNKWNNHIMRMVGNYENLQTSIYEIPQNYLEKLHIDLNKQIYVKAQILLSKHELNELKSYSNPISTAYNYQMSTILLSNETTFSTSKQISYENEYLTVIVDYPTGGNVPSSPSYTFGVNTNDNYIFYYSFDKYNWYKNDHHVVLFAYDKPIYIKGYIYNKNVSNQTKRNFFAFGPNGSFTLNVHISGNIRSLITGDNFLGNDCDYVDFRYAFTGTNIYSAEHLILPSTGLTNNCFEGMFKNCTNLRYPPKLPATKLAAECYMEMFNGCTNLRETPELPASYLSDDATNGWWRCYERMFYGCLNITTINKICARNLYGNTIQEHGESYDLNVYSFGTNFYPKFSSLMFQETFNANNSNVITAYICKSSLKYIPDNYTEHVLIKTGSYTVSDYTYDFSNNIILDAIPFEEQYLTQTLVGDGQGKFIIGKLVNDEIYAYQIWLDDFGPDPDEPWDYQAFINDPLRNGSNPYYYTGDTITYNNTKYYIWKYNYDLVGEEEGSTSSDEVKYLFTTTINYSELYNESLEQSISNVPTLLYGISENKSISRITYGIQENYYRIVKIEDKRNISYVAYSINNGESWEYTEIPNYNDEIVIITPKMPEGSKILWKGKANRYFNNPMYEGDKQTKLTYTYNNTTYKAIDYIYSVIQGTQTNIIKNSTYDYMSYLSADNDFELSGNIMSLLYGDDFIGQNTISDYAFTCLFMGNGYLTNTYELCLPATNIGKYSYSHMFWGEQYMNTMPMICASVLYEGSCSHMFQYCRRLSELCFTVTELNNIKKYGEAKYACKNMFDNIGSGKSTYISLKNIHLYAKHLTSMCYAYMFINDKINEMPSGFFINVLSFGHRSCAAMFYSTKITTLPSIFTQTANLGYACFNAMFADCSYLTTISESFLPFITLKPDCYYDMFYGCTSLTTAPKLPAKVVHTHSYYGMFNHCSSLNYIQIDALEQKGEDQYVLMLNDVSSSGTIICRYDANPTISSIVPSGWNKYVSTYYNVPLTIKALQTGTVGIYIGKTILSNATATVYTKIDDNEWEMHAVKSYASEYGNVTINLESGSTVSIVANYSRSMSWAVSSTLSAANWRSTIHIVSETIPIEAYGNILSLNVSTSTTNWLNNQGTLRTGNFAYLFVNSFNLGYIKHNLVKADNLYLPDVACTDYMYNYAFVKAAFEKTPIMPFTTLGASCCWGMYYHCENLKKSEPLPATTLTSFCYRGMYSDCYSLTIAPVLPATDWSSSLKPYTGMFANCNALKYMKMSALSLQYPSSYGNTNFVQGVSGSGIFIIPDNIGKQIDKYNSSRPFAYCPNKFTVYNESDVATPIKVKVNYSPWNVSTATINATQISIYQGTVATATCLTATSGTRISNAAYGTYSATVMIASDGSYRFNVNNSNISTFYTDTVNPIILDYYADSNNGYIYHASAVQNWHDNYNSNNPETNNNQSLISPNLNNPRIISASIIF